MPVVQFAVIAAFEARASEAKRLDIVAVGVPDDRGRHVRSVGDSIGRRHFAAQGGRALQSQHDPASLLCIARSTPTNLRKGATVNLFMTIDCRAVWREKIRPSRDRQSGRSSAEIESD